MEFWSGISLDVSLPVLNDVDYTETCDTEAWNQKLCFGELVPEANTHAPEMESCVTSELKTISKQFCVTHSDISYDMLMSQFWILQRLPSYRHVRDLSPRVIAAGCLYICAKQKLGITIPTKNIMKASGLSGPTVRKATTMFDHHFY